MASDRCASSTSAAVTEQAAELARVRSRIAEAILRAYWYQTRRAWGSWHVDDLRRYVEAQVGPVAPGSPDRILRDLRARRLLNYRVVNRRQSLYRWEPISREPLQLEGVRVGQPLKPGMWRCTCGKVWLVGRVCNVCRMSEAQAKELREKQ